MKQEHSYTKPVSDVTASRFTRPHNAHHLASLQPKVASHGVRVLCRCVQEVKAEESLKQKSRIGRNWQVLRS
jgi:hypothetical protein